LLESAKRLQHIRSRLSSGDIVPVDDLTRMPYHAGKFGGIYLIRNELNGRLYVGSSKNIKTRKCCHIGTLNRRTHRNKFLQADWDKCGANAFVFYIVEEVTENRLIEMEQHYLDLFMPDVDGYNLGETAECPNRGRKLSKEALEKHNTRLRENPPTEIAICQMDLDGNFVKKWRSARVAGLSCNISEKTINHVCRGNGKSAGGYQWCYAVDKISRLGKKCIRRSTGREKHPVVQYSITGNYIGEWNNSRQASISTGISSCSILLACKGKYNNAGGFQWRFKGDNLKVKPQNGNRIIGVRVYQITDDGEIVNKWDKQSVAARGVGIHASTISLSCKSLGRTLAGGFRWCYEYDLERCLLARGVA